MGGRELLLRLSLSFPRPTSTPRPASRAGAMLRSVEAQSDASDASEHELNLQSRDLWDGDGVAKGT
jgi:hypothetical protein